MHCVLLPLFLDRMPRLSASALEGSGRTNTVVRSFFRRAVNIYRSYMFLTVETNKL